ncbi:hypothetical protein [Serratia fonticola]|uniref:hypothetical protein n=1 Tax=Serratia fonticola TaxID=47917 RepID=UPI00137911F7|nr:hypothetical protein [Serratia fonticola]NCG50816.1 hypothetical protein [Serratia fonticola]
MKFCEANDSPERLVNKNLSVCIQEHVFALDFMSNLSPTAPALARFPLSQTTAFKETHEAGRRGGDSIARRVNFIFKKQLIFRVVAA